MAEKDRLADYVPVHERIEQFYSQFEVGRILTSIIEHDPEHGFILMRAEIYRATGDAVPAATGHAFEYRTEGYVNKTSYIENCETSCVGRALALLGFEIKRGIASREEMQKVRRMTAGATCVSPDQVGTLTALAEEVGANLKQFCKYFKVESLSGLPADSYQNAVDALEKKRKIAQKKAAA